MIGQKIQSSIGLVFSDLKVIKLGIQGPPGMQFYFNNQDTSQITMNNYGIYELDLENIGYISSLNISRLPTGQTVYVDYVTEEAGGVGN